MLTCLRLCLPIGFAALAGCGTAPAATTSGTGDQPAADATADEAVSDAVSDAPADALSDTFSVPDAASDLHADVAPEDLVPVDAASDATATTCFCGDSVCNTTPCGETAETCPADCKGCGNGVCEPGEGPKSCPVDCCGTCGDGKCKGYDCGETSESCAKDCGSACGNKVCDKGESPQSCAQDCLWQACGNGVCEGSDGGPASCPQDCGTACGDGTCEAGEDFIGCPIDCGYCGDGLCSVKIGESAATCMADCKGGECDPDLPSDVTKCDDGNPCTLETCPPAGVCHHPPVPGACDDGSICTTGDHCQLGGCVLTNMLDCADGNPCTADLCDPATGCQHTLVGGACSDGDACTVGDFCNNGGCSSGIAANCEDGDLCTLNTCAPASGCTATANDGAICNDGNLCTTEDACQGAVCHGTGVQDCADGNPCTSDQCAAATGCVHLPGIGTCTDGNACTQDDSCVNAICTPGAIADCNDGNACTADGCNLAIGCTHKPTTAACDDANPCTTSDICQGGGCQGGPGLDCDDANVCTQDSCDVASGCTSTADEGALCSDGDVCTVGDACQMSACLAGGGLTCEDGNPCTFDACNPGAGCTHKGLGGACEDGNACTKGDQCFNAVCMPGPGLDCADGNPCTLDNCDAQGGCTHSHAGGACTDGDACTAGDVCKLGTCKAGAAVDCVDGNPCTDDSCITTSGCVHLANAATCTDGSACSQGDTCLGGSCAAGSAVNCDDGNPCTADGCDSATACQHKPTSAACDDENACTLGDVCKAGVCDGGAPRSCDDGNACTVDACNPANGCTSTIADGGACSDGDLCTAGDACTNGVCAAGAASACDDGNPCTTDSCSVHNGCQHQATGGACDDKNACTQGDVCANSVCTSGGPIGCDDGNPCTLDGCEQTAGCTHGLTTGGVCSDGDACSTLDSCSDGACKGHGALQCADNTPCTADGCDSASGCTHEPVAATCDDGSVCTDGDHCAAGICVPTASLDCVDSDPCTNDLCNAASGCSHPPNTGNSCNDGNVCTVGDTCTNGFCIGEANSCSDGNVCTDDGCASGTGCGHTANVSACEDGDACTLDDACGNGSCKAGMQMPCDDDSVCTTGDHCLSGNCVAGTAVSCDDANPCTADSCDGIKGCQYADNGGALCGDSGVCSGGQCACPGGFSIQGDHCPPVLTGILLEGAALAPTFHIGITAYTASLPLITTETHLTVMAPSGVAVTLSANGGPISTLTVGQPSTAALRMGANTFKLTAIHAGMSKVYEVAVTRLPTVQQAYVKAKNTGQMDSFGASMAFSGDTLVIGAPLDDSNASGIDGDSANNGQADSGSVQIFRRKGKTWAFEAYLKPSNPDAADQFGASVAIDGDRLVVGAPRESSWPTSVLRGSPDNTWPESGGVYVFARQNGQWRQRAVLKAAGGDAGDRFGEAVTVSGGTIAVGCPGEDSKAVGVNGDSADNSAAQSGAVYVFADRYGTWRQEAYLKASNGEAGDLFGSDVALSGETLLVGAPGEASKAAGVGGSQANNAAPGAGAGYVFVRADGIWAQHAYLKASNPDVGDHFGNAVGLDGDTAVLGASGEDGNGVNPLDNSRTDSGAGYIFSRSSGQWSQRSYLKAGTADAMDQFGAAVAIEGGRIVVGAPGESSGDSGVNAEQADNMEPSSGAAYLFARVGSVWSLAAYLKASNPQANDSFGSAVALGGNTVVAASPGEASQATLVGGDQGNNGMLGAGAVYVYSGDACLLGEVAECDDADPCTVDACEASQFCSHAAEFEGHSCGAGGATCTLGACACATDLLYENGVCRPTLTSLAASAGALLPDFESGTPIFHIVDPLAASSTLTAVAAPDVSLALSLGDSPTMTSMVSGAPSSATGLPVGVNTLMTVFATRGGITAAHDVYAWKAKARQNAYVKASTTDALDAFGSTVAISGYTMVVGAPGERSCSKGINGDETSNACSEAGAAYVFTYQSGAWIQTAYLKASNTKSNQRFGAAVAVSGNYIIVGAPGEASASSTTPNDTSKPAAGAAYVFALQSGAWVQEAYLKGVADVGDQLGYSVAIAGTLAIVGAPYEASCSTFAAPDNANNGCPGAGAARVYERTAAGNWNLQIYLKATNTGMNDNFGAAVSAGGVYNQSGISYDWFAVGAPGEANGTNTNTGDDSAAGAGAVYMYNRRTSTVTTTWNAAAYVKVPLIPQPGDQFGAAIALRFGNGSYILVVGAPGGDHTWGPPGDSSWTDSGTAFLFIVNPMTGVAAPGPFVKAAIPGTGDKFGAAVDWSNNRLVVGAPGEASGARGVDGNPQHDGAAESGAAYVFENCPSGCSSSAYIKASNSEAFDHFGSSVACGSGILAVGAESEAGAGPAMSGDQTSNAKPLSGAVYMF